MCSVHGNHSRAVVKTEQTQRTTQQGGISLLSAESANGARKEKPVPLGDRGLSHGNLEGWAAPGGKDFQQHPAPYKVGEGKGPGEGEMWWFQERGVEMTAMHELSTGILIGPPVSCAWDRSEPFQTRSSITICRWFPHATCSQGFLPLH